MVIVLLAINIVLKLSCAIVSVHSICNTLWEVLLLTKRDARLRFIQIKVVGINVQKP